MSQVRPNALYTPLYILHEPNKSDITMTVISRIERTNGSKKRK